MDVGRSNIEFEAKLTADILFHVMTPPLSICCIAFQSADSQVTEEYMEWIRDDLTNDDGRVPLRYEEIQDMYFYFMEEFRMAKPEYNYPSDPGLLPDAMFDLFNN